MSHVVDYLARSSVETRLSGSNRGPVWVGRRGNPNKPLHVTLDERTGDSVGVGKTIAVFGLTVVVAAACTGSHMPSPAPPPQAGKSAQLFGSCRLGELNIELGHGGLANASDFAVFEVRNRGRRPCAMRQPVTVTALDKNGQRTPAVRVMRSASARPPIVLSPSGANGLGILVSGGNAIGVGGCPAERIIRPWAWRISLGGRAVTVRNRTPSVAASLTACRLGGQGFALSRQTLNRQLSIQPQPK